MASQCVHYNKQAKLVSLKDTVAEHGGETHLDYKVRLCLPSGGGHFLLTITTCPDVGVK